MSTPLIPPPYVNNECYHIRRIKKYAWYYTSAWTLLLIGSFFITVKGYEDTLAKIALTEARAAINRDLLYRQWSASHGGLYAPVTINTPPNPYISKHLERDVITPSGRKLTLINPSYMNRQVYDLAIKTDITIGPGHITSLNPIRPENAPDPWEKKALESFEKGTREYSEMVQIDGQPFMRLMRAFETEKTCLECHAAQGYIEGNIRGGMSVTLPARQLNDATHDQIVGSMATHSVIWLLGLFLNIYVEKKLIRNVLIQKQGEQELKEQALQLKQEIINRQTAQEALQINEEKLHEQNYELLATGEMLREQLGQYDLSQTHLKESNSTLQAIFDVTPLPIIITSYADGIVREINRTFTETFGYKRNESIGKNSFDLGIWNVIAERHYFIGVINDQNGVSAFPAEIKNVNGEVRNILLYGNRIDYKDEKCLLVVFMDITDQKRIEYELRQSQKMEVVGQLAGGIAHDFNNMLTAILGSAEMMEKYVKNKPVEEKLLNTIREAAGRSADLTAQLLAFSRKGSSIIVQIWINKAIKTVISLLEHSIDKNIKIETRLTAERDLVIGDTTQLQNSLLNLGINARDAMQEGGTITFTTANVFLDVAFCRSNGSHLQPGDYIEISVSDTGTGIDKKVLEHIFEPFFTTKGIGKGTGLGLAAVYGTVKEHNGCVTVFSEPGLGTVFKLYIPLAEEQKQNTIVVADKTRPRDSGGILLVDDEVLIRNMGQALLLDHGYQVYLAENGAEALEVYERERENISLVILDVVMPVMGGKEALQRLTESYPNIRVLISSGFHHDENSDSFIKQGAVGFIQKPYNTRELFKAVDEAIHDTL